MCSLPCIQVYLGSMLYFAISIFIRPRSICPWKRTFAATEGIYAWQFQNIWELMKTSQCTADDLKTRESQWKHNERLLRDWVWQTLVCKKQAPLTLPHVLKLTLDFISVYNSATINRPSPSSQNVTSHSPHHPLFKSWAENIWQMPAWSFPPN